MKTAEEFDGEAINLQHIGDHLHRADIVIASTASPLPVLGKGTVERALKKRKHAPIFMVDLAVPRDIEPEVNKLDDVYLYTVDDLQEVINENLENRQQAAEQAPQPTQRARSMIIAWRGIGSSWRGGRRPRASAAVLRLDVEEVLLLARAAAVCWLLGRGGGTEILHT